MCRLPAGRLLLFDELTDILETVGHRKGKEAGNVTRKTSFEIILYKIHAVSLDIMQNIILVKVRVGHMDSTLVKVLKYVILNINNK